MPPQLQLTLESLRDEHIHTDILREEEIDKVKLRAALTAIKNGKD